MLSNLIPKQQGTMNETVVNMVLASRASGCLFGQPNPSKHPSGHPNFIVRNFLKCQSQAYN